MCVCVSVCVLFTSCRVHTTCNLAAARSHVNVNWNFMIAYGIFSDECKAAAADFMTYAVESRARAVESDLVCREETISSARTHIGHRSDDYRMPRARRIAGMCTLSVEHANSSRVCARAVLARASRRHVTVGCGHAHRTATPAYSIITILLRTLRRRVRKPLNAARTLSRVRNGEHIVAIKPHIERPHEHASTCARSLLACMRTLACVYYA